MTINVHRPDGFPKLTEDQYALAQLMSYISEEHYSAGWICGLEYTLWGYVSGAFHAQQNFGMGIPNRGLIKLLGIAAIMIGGWIVWDEASDDGRRFVPIEEWLKEFNEWQNPAKTPVVSGETP